MKCPKCNGQRYKAPDMPCGRCDGKGVVEPLNEQEYLQTCTTEQLAEEISHLVFGGDFKKHISKRVYINMHSFKTEIVEWLKQPHRKEHNG